MSWEAIQAAAQVQPAGSVALPAMPMDLRIGMAGQVPSTQTADASAALGQFGQMVTSGIADVNQQLMASQTGLQQLATGTAPNLHQVMIGLEESRLSFQLLMQVRNRLLEAYQDVMKMQV